MARARKASAASATVEVQRPGRPSTPPDDVTGSALPPTVPAESGAEQFPQVRGGATRRWVTRRDGEWPLPCHITADVGPALPGGVVVRSHRCGKPGCRCIADPPRPHGPHNSWTRKIDGKTVTRLLTDDQLRDYTPLFDASRRLRELIAELENVTVRSSRQTSGGGANEPTDVRQRRTAQNGGSGNCGGGSGIGPLPGHIVRS